jgi:3,4-dihydroxy 2-butanone 4-phosphate synthase / GTP cyclohydrolase II
VSSERERPQTSDHILFPASTFEYGRASREGVPFYQANLEFEFPSLRESTLVPSFFKEGCLSVKLSPIQQAPLLEKGWILASRISHLASRFCLPSLPNRAQMSHHILLVMPKRLEYVDTDLMTDFGAFNIRVYEDVTGKETVVFYTEDLNNNQPVLVRIHSECMTGDTFKSKHCDCGEQLATALKMIRAKGGALIYLRQEGRGIGLFEKIKTYQLQRTGVDTFDANTLLGHKPDARTYGMAKIALKDLKIKRILLLTNNPSKVLEMKKLGINVSRRVPLVVPSNEYNQKYFETKKKKFKHHL